MEEPESTDAPEQPIADTESLIVLGLYAAVTRLNERIAEARKHQIEVTVDVQYDRVLDAFRPHDVIVGVKIAKLLR